MEHRNEEIMEKVRIQLQNISKSYYSETAVTQALRKVNLTFSMGEFVAITGESGSGKSTLLNIIGGMDTFDEGEMFVDGEPTFQYDDEDWENYRRTKIGYVFQDYSLVGHYSALDNIKSALLIMGAEPELAEQTAMKYLEQVGLEGYETHRASELSSGQKQRLSIARALAKNTDIIVADEPTGNLDSETGNQIIKLLQELSKDRLVIMVTHNYDQAEPYVTRKVRVHDGQIVSDVQVNNGVEVGDTVSDVSSETTGEPIHKPLPVQKMDHRWKNKTAAFFAKRNFQTQIGRAILFTSFLLIIAVVSFLFIGELFLHGDDYSTRTYSQATFRKEDNTRLIVKRSDGKDLLEEDVKKISGVRYVETVDSCDIANDINFYMEEGKDYKYIYGRSRDHSEGVKTVTFMKEDRFMMSDDCITKEDLSAGRLPEARNEIVLYSKGGKALNTDILCYFMAKNIWPSSQYYQTDLKVVGILKEKTDQVYFSKELCAMLSMYINSGTYRVLYEYDYSLKDYRKKVEFIPVVNDKLRGMDVIISGSMENPPAAGFYEYSWQDKDQDGNPVGDLISGSYLNILPEQSENTSMFMEVSKSFFDQYYKKNSTQASVYITSYAKTDAVIKKLEKLGYEAISSYRVSMTDYKEELVNQRLMIIGISAFGLLAILFAEILILRSLMKIRIKDYFVLKFIGMKLQIIRRISYFEMSIYTAVAVAVTIVLMWILRLSGIGIIQDIMWYYDWETYLLFILYNFLLIVLTVASFNRILKGRLNA